MARKFLTAIDLGTNELQNAVIQNLAAASEPSGVKGRIYFDSTNNIIKFYDGSAWKALATGGDLGGYQPVDDDLTAIADLTGTGILTRTGTNTWSLDTNTYLTSADLSGYVTETGTQTLSNKTISDALAFYDGTGSQSTIYASGSDLSVYAHNDLYLNTNNGNINLQPDGVAQIWGNEIATQSWVTGQSYATTSSLDSYLPNSGNNTYTGNLQFFAADNTTPMSGMASVEYKGDTDANGVEGLYITSSRGWINDPPSHPQTGGKLFISSYDLIDINAQHGNIQLWTPNGGIYVNDELVASQDWVGSQGYLTSETDPVYTASSWYTTTNNSSNWDTAYGWGNHASAGYITSVSGTSNEISVSTTGGAVTVSLPDDVTIGGDLTVTGDLTVNGAVTTLNTQTVAVEDNVLMLNSNVTDTATDAGIEVNRGTVGDNAAIYWNESMGSWWAGNTGSMSTILLSGIATHEDISDFTTGVDSEIDSYLTGSDSISISSGSIDTSLATTSYLTKTGGLAVDKTSLSSALKSDGFVKSYAENNSAITVSGGVATWTVSHGLGSRDVTVQVYELSGYGAVEVDVTRTSTSAVTITWNSASNITADTYRVVVTG